MTAIGRLCRMSAAERRLRAQAVALLVVVRVGLVLMPLRRLRWVLAGLVDAVRRPDCCELDAGVATVSQAVAGAARIVPWTTCLSTALALQALCELRGMAATVFIGVRKGTAGELEAHAWVEAGGVIAIGTPTDGDYHRSATFSRMRP
jgi:hypothetical protein